MLVLINNLFDGYYSHLWSSERKRNVELRNNRYNRILTSEQKHVIKLHDIILNALHRLDDYGGSEHERDPSVLNYMVQHVLDMARGVARDFGGQP